MNSLFILVAALIGSPALSVLVTWLINRKVDVNLHAFFSKSLAFIVVLYDNEVDVAQSDRIRKGNFLNTMIELSYTTFDLTNYTQFMSIVQRCNNSVADSKLELKYGKQNLAKQFASLCETASLVKDPRYYKLVTSQLVSALVTIAALMEKEENILGKD